VPDGASDQPRQHARGAITRPTPHPP
jgi:hypothetical protein